MTADNKPHVAVESAAEPMVTTIRWHRPAERMPAYGQTVVVWIQSMGLTVRARRGIPGGMWRGTGTSMNWIDDNLITAWTDAPNGPLPPPDGTPSSASRAPRSTPTSRAIPRGLKQEPTCQIP